MSRPTSRSRTEPYVSQPENLTMPEGAITEETVGLLDELIHPHHHADSTLVDDETSVRSSAHNDQPIEDSYERELWQRLPWWKRPSPLWIICLVPLTAIAMATTIAPKVEIYTMLVCQTYKPEHISNDITEYSFNQLAHTANSSQIYFRNLGQPEEDSRSRCASDPVVQAAVAKLATAIMTSMGILSCVTTAWWGLFSDRKGRTRLLGISATGLLFNDLNFILVARYAHRLPGGYWWLILGPIVEGCVGGLSGAIAGIHAYVADTTAPEKRSRTFSVALGLLFCGMALGPSIGGLLIRSTQQTLSVFYLATSSHFLYACAIWFIIPESLSKARMRTSQEKYDLQLLDSSRARQTNSAAGVWVRLTRIFAFLSPLTIFIPQRVQSGNPLKRAHRDWSLTMVAASYASTILLMGSYTFKMQYAAATFDWNSEKLGYFLSLVGAGRALFLTVILPLIIKLFKPRSPQASGETGHSSRHPSRSRPEPAVNEHSSKFDLALARASLSIEVLAYTLLALMAQSPIAFMTFSVAGSLGTGFSPAVQAVALDLYTRQGMTETGRLFGALSVLQALFSQIIAPSLFGVVYMATVADHPKAIFILCAAVVAAALGFLSLVRLPRADITHARQASDEEEELLGPVARENTFIDEPIDEDTPGKGTVGSRNSPEEAA